jgi:hypothetical protein
MAKRKTSSNPQSTIHNPQSSEPLATRNSQLTPEQQVAQIQRSLESNPPPTIVPRGTVRVCHRCKAVLADDWTSEICPRCAPPRETAQSTTTTIHTYFEATELNYEEEIKLLLAWQHRWESLGYKTRVINEWHARQNPRFEAFSKRIAAIHSINPAGYETACWYRHCAMEYIGGGAMSDHDVVPSRFEPIPVNDKLTIFEKGVPSLISGSAAAFGVFCQFIIDLKDPAGDPGHRSDMTEIRSLPGLVVDSRCVQFGDTDWRAANWTHFSHASTEKHRPRWKHIEPLMAQKEAA